MWIVGLIVLIGVGLYVLFMAVDGFGLQKWSSAATVVDKDYRPPGRTYTTQVIGGRTQTIPQITSEMFILKLVIGGRTTACAVAKALYDAIKINDQVQVICRQRRITGALQVVEVIRS